MYKKISCRHYLSTTLSCLLLCVSLQGHTDDLNGPALQASLLFTPFPEIRNDNLRLIRERGNKNMVPALVYALRYLPDENGEITKTLRALSNENLGNDWADWMLWQQANPEIVPFDGFDAFQSDMFANIDPAFKTFLYPGVAHKIRLEEIAWGGVKKDGIPALTNPALITVAEAAFLADNEPVFGIEINGDRRAYPYRFMDWHEMFNDVIGGIPVSLAYCTLCGSGILYDTRREASDEPFIFGSSGFLYRSNKLMYDKQTNSLWNQFTGQPVVGVLSDSDIKLNILPVLTTTWGEWRKRHPDTKVLSMETGFQRNYTPGEPYGDYFASPELMFPALSTDKRLKQKDQVFGLRLSGAEKAWPLDAFKNGKVINDRVGAVTIVLIGDEKRRTVRAYRSSGRVFSKANDDLSTVQSEHQDWLVTEDALISPDKQKLSRLPGHIAYWFAWSNYLKDAELFLK